MKKTITGLFLGTTALALAACGGAEVPAAEEAVEETAAEVVPEEAMMEETPEAAAADGEVPLGGTGTPIGPSASDAEE